MESRVGWVLVGLGVLVLLLVFGPVYAAVAALAAVLFEVTLEVARMRRE